MADIYECNECSGSYCEGCDPSIVCDICANTICPDCENTSTQSDNRHSVVCVECFDRLSPSDQLKFEKRKDTFNPSTSVLKDGNALKDVSDALESIKGDLNGK